MSHYRKRRTRTRRRGNRNKNMLSIANSTSRKFMPKVKHGLENVGNNVVKTGEQTLPFFQQITRKLLSFGANSKRRRRRRRH
jgi:hypothetical protein